MPDVVPKDLRQEFDHGTFNSTLACRRADPDHHPPLAVLELIVSAWLPTSTAEQSFINPNSV
jgi:hypothetical protein